MTAPAAPVPPSSWMQYNPANRVASSNILPAGFVYDAAGNVLNDGVNQYVYDGESRLCAVKNLNGSLFGYIYDAEGRRVAKGTLTTLSCIPGANGFVLTSSYLLGLNGEQVSETDANGNWLHTNVFANGGLLATYSGANTYFALNDGLGTKRAQYTATGVLTNYASLPFGDNLTPSGPGPDATEHHFTGKERDTESGLDYFGARYYGSNIGRFMSPDPGPYVKHDPQTWNRYAYTRNNPLKYIDPTGMYFVISSNYTAAKQYISTLLRNDSGAALVRQIAADPRPTYVVPGRLPITPNANGTRLNITNGTTTPLESVPGKATGTSVVIDPLNAIFTSQGTGESPFGVGLKAFTHELFHVSDINGAKTFADAAVTNAAGDAPSVPGATDTVGGTAEKRAEGITNALGSQGTSFVPNPNTDRETDQIIKNGLQQQQSEEEQNQLYTGTFQDRPE